MDAVLGWLRLKPGKREAFMSQVPRYLAATRSMDGVLFAEINPSHEDADLVVLTFGYRDATAHRALVDAPQERELSPYWMSLPSTGASRTSPPVAAAWTS